MRRILPLSSQIPNVSKLLLSKTQTGTALELLCGLDSSSSPQSVILKPVAVQNMLEMHILEASLYPLL